MTRFYTELATWWHLISSPDDYREEVDFFLPLLADMTKNPEATLLELGSGGGNNALHMKSSFAAVTLLDLSQQMLAASQTINPDCEHLQGDMRSARLNRTFDVVFVHDAVDYMLTRDDLRQAIETAFIHCKPGGMALFIPDHVRETFEQSSDVGGTDGDGRGVRYLEWTLDPDPEDTTVITDFVFLLREGDLPPRVIHDRHTFGLFALADWLTLLKEAGFQTDVVIDDFERHVFIARKS
jgi:SAM-dependent methyltransferase